MLIPVWKYEFTSVVQKLLDQEYNVHGLRLIVPPVSGGSNHKSFLQELSFSIQTHSNCKMALIVGFVSISEMMNCKRKMCIRELTECYTFSNCSLLSTGMPFLPLDCHQVLRGLPVHGCLQIVLHCYWHCCVDSHILYTEWQFCFLFANLITFLFYFYDSYSYFFLNFIILYQYHPK